MSTLTEKENKSIVATSCRFCEFRKNDEKGNQVGCEVGYLERFPAEKITTQEIDNDSFKQVESACLFRRHSGWKEAKAPETTEYYDILVKEILEAFDKSFTLVVYVLEGKTMEDVRKTVKSIEKLTRKPTKVIFINYAKIRPIEFLVLNQETNIKWSMEYILEENVSRMRLTDIASKKLNTVYFADINAGLDINDNFFVHVANSLITGENSFLLAKTDNINLYNTKIYKLFGGNKDDNSFEDKLKQEAEEQKCQHLIMDYQE